MVGSCASSTYIKYANPLNESYMHPVVVQVDPLTTSDSYPAPISDSTQGVLSASKCTCQRIAYNLESACSYCQNKTEYLRYLLEMAYLPFPYLITCKAGTLFLSIVTTMLDSGSEPSYSRNIYKHLRNGNQLYKACTGGFCITCVVHTTDASR